MEKEMKNLDFKRAGLWFAILTATSLNSAIASGHPSPCQQSAVQMKQACYHDIQDNLRTAQANCTNLSDRSDRRACRREAKASSKEESHTCKDQFKARIEACELLGEVRYDSDPLLNPSILFVDPQEVTPGSANPYVSIVAGQTSVMRSGDEVVVVHVTGDVRVIQGVTCRIVVDVALESEVNTEDGTIDYIPLEVTDDWLAQDLDANVYYCGELSRNFEDGVLTDLDGSFEAGQDFAKAGMLFMAYPDIGSAHRQEFALGEAEDIVHYLDLTASPAEENPLFPCESVGGCLMTHDFTPMDPEVSEFKYYIPGVGFVLAETLENGELTGETESLVCTGGSLEVLHEPECGIDNPDTLIEVLCKVAPDAFCD
jgi:hypothetical protein